MVGTARSGTGFGDGNSYYNRDKKSKKRSELRKLIHLNRLVGDSSIAPDKESDLFDKQVNNRLEKYNKIQGASKRKHIQNHVLRLMFSLPADEKLTEEEWLNFVYDYGQELGYDFQNHQMAVYLHNDTENQHVHVQLNRISDGNDYIINDSNIGRKTDLICRKLTPKYNLSALPIEKKSVKDSKRSFERTESNSYVRSVMSALIDKEQILKVAKERNQPITPYFLQQILLEQGIEANIKFSAEEKFVGFSVSYKGESFTGQNIGWKAGTLATALDSLEAKRLGVGNVTAVQKSVLSLSQLDTETSPQKPTVIANNDSPMQLEESGGAKKYIYTEEQKERDKAIEERNNNVRKRGFRR